MKKILLFLLFPCFLFCEQHYWKYIDKISEQQDLYLKKMYGLTPCSIGGGGVGCIEKVIRDYEAPYEANLTLIRTIFVDMVNRYYFAVNNCQKLKSHLNPYPLPLSGFDLSLHFLENPKLLKDKKQIVFVYMKNEKIRYRYNTHTNKGYASFHEETFAEASAIVKEQNEKMKQTFPELDVGAKGN